ncbi:MULTISPECIES: hypothetical protein [unclassified Psychrobacter]|nr:MULTISPECIES: hypothetical protein [unclassified Psychrobacter]
MCIFASVAIATGMNSDIASYHYPLFIPTATAGTRSYSEARLSIIIYI